MKDERSDLRGNTYRLDHGHARPLHGGRSRTYRSWEGMKRRCFNPSEPTFSRYGAVGITCCERWREFGNFLADMGECPSGMSLDRIDNSRGYEPGNCRWATPKQQARNRRSNRLLDLHGRIQSFAAWCEEFGMPPETVRLRVKRGASLEAALTAPIINGKKAKSCAN